MVRLRSMTVQIIYKYYTVVEVTVIRAVPVKISFDRLYWFLFALMTSSNVDGNGPDANA